MERHLALHRVVEKRLAGKPGTTITDPVRGNWHKAGADMPGRQLGQPMHRAPIRAAKMRERVFVRSRESTGRQYRAARACGH